MITAESRKQLREGIAEIRSNAALYATDPLAAADTIVKLTQMCDTMLDQIAADMNIILGDTFDKTLGDLLSEDAGS